MTVYLIHIDPPYKHARHYIGYTAEPATFADRFKAHLFGNGSPLLRAASEAGCALQVAHIWPDGDRRFERYLKDRRDTARYCPKCGGRRPIPQAVPKDYQTSTERKFRNGKYNDL